MIRMFGSGQDIRGAIAGPTYEENVMYTLMCTLEEKYKTHSNCSFSFYHGY